jgi:tRNA threonylcarbamoyladenosine biosynthesis protein TsaB
MNFLALDTSTEQLHLGVCKGEVVLTRVCPGAAQASAQIVPLCLALLAEAGLRLGELDAIVMGRGPGSFTGLRTACAVAQGLAFGADVPVLPLDTLLAVAEDARQGREHVNVWTVQDARMGQYYAAAWSYADGLWHNVDPPALHDPHELCFPVAWRNNPATALVAGVGLEGVSAPWQLDSGCPVIDAAPTAAALLRLAPQALRSGQAVPAEQAMPLYLRDKVAQTTAEREALKINEIRN